MELYFGLEFAQKLYLFNLISNTNTNKIIIFNQQWDVHQTFSPLKGVNII